MHVVVGGGIAGLGAAYELRAHGAEVTLLEAAPVVGGRCRSVYWHGQWLITGATAFHEADNTIVNLSEQLGLGLNSDNLLDLSDAHSIRVVRGDTNVEVDDFTVAGLLSAKGIPVTEKVQLSRLLPLARRLHSETPATAEAAASELDDIDACHYLRGFAPTFTDYVVEPTMQMFCGWSEGDYSLGWLLSMLGPVKLGIEKTAKLKWWTFRERGVGALSHQLGEQLKADQGCVVRTNTPARNVNVTSDGVVVKTDTDVIHADGVVVATPAPQALSLLASGILSAEHEEFLKWICYRGHHIVYFLVNALPGYDHSGSSSGQGDSGFGLATADGQRTISNYSVKTIDDGVLIYAELKGGACASLTGNTDDEVLNAAWAELVKVVPGAADATVNDRLLSRNDIGLCTYPTGYLRRKTNFAKAPLHPRIALAGDWLENCTVGSAHLTGLAAAQRLLATTTI